MTKLAIATYFRTLRSEIDLGATERLIRGNRVSGPLAPTEVPGDRQASSCAEVLVGGRISFEDLKLEPIG